MAWITTLALFVITISLTAASFNTPSLPDFHYPDGKPNHQTGFHSGTLNCVRSPADCACPTTFFPPAGCYHCPCTSGMGPSVLPTSLPTTPVSPVPTATMTTGTFIPVTSHVTSSVTNYCDIAKNLCRKNCPEGYLVDPDDCTFCLCKNDLITG